jgi:hypothetical protein
MVKKDCEKVPNKMGSWSANNPTPMTAKMQVTNPSNMMLFRTGTIDTRRASTIAFRDPAFPTRRITRSTRSALSEWNAGTSASTAETTLAEVDTKSNTCMSYEEEDTCKSYEEEDTWQRLTPSQTHAMGRRKTLVCDPVLETNGRPY